MRLTQALIAREEWTEAQAEAFRDIMAILESSLGFGDEPPISHFELEDATVNIYRRFRHLFEG